MPPVPVLPHRVVVGVAQGNLEMGDVRHEHLPQPHVPLVEFKCAVDVTVACRKVRLESWRGKPALRLS